MKCVDLMLLSNSVDGSLREELVEFLPGAYLSGQVMPGMQSAISFLMNAVIYLLLISLDIWP